MPGRPEAAAGSRAAQSTCKTSFRKSLTAPLAERGFALHVPTDLTRRRATGRQRILTIGHGAVVIAAITSCTNTSNPIGHARRRAAGQEGRRERPARRKPYVKTSLAPGSRVVTDYLKKAGLDEPLDAARLPHGRLRLHHLHRQQRPAARAGGRRPSREGNLVAAAVLSGNRNFEGRINPLVKANYLASPPLVVAYALAGTIDIDLTTRTARHRTSTARPVFLQDIWPTPEESRAGDRQPCVLPEMFSERYAAT